MADYQKTKTVVKNSTFHKNYAVNGGVFFVQFESTAEVINSTITKNFAISGGVAYVSNNGAVMFRNSTIDGNGALETSVALVFDSVAATSVFEQTTINANEYVTLATIKAEVIACSKFCHFSTAFKNFIEERFTLYEGLKGEDVIKMIKSEI